MKPLAPHKDRYPRIKRDLAVLKWMVGVNLVGVAFLAIKAFT
jgi:hypothetical protein